MVSQLCELRACPTPSWTIRGMRFIRSDFVDFLGLFRLSRKYITLTPLDNGGLDIRVHGPGYTILFGSRCWPSSAEVYYRNTQPGLDRAEGRRRPGHQDRPDLQAPGLRGLRSPTTARASFSLDWQREVLGTLKARLGCDMEQPADQHQQRHAGAQAGPAPMGTMAHEYRPARRWGPRLRDRCSAVKWAQNTGATWASLSDVYGMVPSCATSTRISASCSTARAATQATRSSGASA